MQARTLQRTKCKTHVTALELNVKLHGTQHVSSARAVLNATHAQCTFTTHTHAVHATRMHFTCSTHSIHKQHACSTPAVHATHVHFPCSTQHMQYKHKTHAMHMQYKLGSTHTTAHTRGSSCTARHTWRYTHCSTHMAVHTWKYTHVAVHTWQYTRTCGPAAPVRHTRCRTGAWC